MNSDNLLAAIPLNSNRVEEDQEESKRKTTKSIRKPRDIVEITKIKFRQVRVESLVVPLLVAKERGFLALAGGLTV